MSVTASTASRSRPYPRLLCRAAAFVALGSFVAGGGAAVWFALRGTDGAQPALPSREIHDARPARPAAPQPLRIVWRRSRSVGLPWRGTLLGAVQLPAEGPDFFTWDPVLRRSPNRGWRRFGSDRLVRLLVRVAAGYARAHPAAARLAIGDLSRPRGGDFGPRYGLPGHVSHQNGLDADVYYPRLDRREREPSRPPQIDRRLAQDLVDRFVAAGATRVFVGPRTGLHGPPGVVQVLARHDNHLHVRIAPP